MTGLARVTEWADENFRSRAAAARAITLDDGRTLAPHYLRLWLTEPARRFDPETARPVAMAVGIPLEAVLFKHERICDLPCEKARSAA